MYQTFNFNHNPVGDKYETIYETLQYASGLCSMYLELINNEIAVTDGFNPSTFPPVFDKDNNLILALDGSNIEFDKYNGTYVKEV